MERRKIRWLIAHTPEYLFIRTAEKFRQELESLLPGQFDVEIYTTDQYIEKFQKLSELKLKRQGVAGLEHKIDSEPVIEGSETNPKWKFYFDALRDGEFEISQTQVTIIGRELDKNFTTLDLPFLFNNHDEVSKVLDNEIGDYLCAALSKKSGIRGLGFTYSGGYRIIGATDSIGSLEDLANTTLLSSTITGNKLFNMLGVDTKQKVSADLTEFVETESNKSVETTYLRFSGKYILKTNHSIFMTTILTGNKFWDSLDQQQQEAFKIAAKRVAIAERAWSIEDAEKYENEAVNNGVQIIDLSDSDVEKLKQTSKASYSAMGDNIVPQLVQMIKKTLH